MTRAEEAAAFLADYEALCAAADAAPVALNGDDRRLALRQHPLQVWADRIRDRLRNVRAKAGRVSQVTDRLQRIFAQQGDFARQTDQQTLDRVVTGGQVEQGGGHRVAHPEISSVLSQAGEDAESPGRETDPAAKPEGRA